MYYYYYYYYYGACCFLDWIVAAIHPHDQE